MIESIYHALDSAFGPFILKYQPIWIITLAGVVIGGAYTLLYYFFMDVEKMRELQKLSKELQKEMREARASNDEKKLRKIQQKQMDLLKKQNELMKQQMIPILLTMPLFWIFFRWLQRWFAEVAIVKAPFHFFLFGWIHSLYHSALQSDELGYLGWYFLTSYAVGMIMRKLLDMG